MISHVINAGIRNAGFTFLSTEKCAAFSTGCKKGQNKTVRSVLPSWLFASILAMMLSGVMPEPASAAAGGEFEGKITISRYAVSADGSEELISQMPMLIHSGYILIEREEGGSVDLIGNIRADGILIRQNRQDFVFLTTDRQAVIMNKQELQQMITMLENMRGAGNNQQADTPEVSMEETNETRTIEGYASRKWIVKTEGSVSEWHVWITNDISIPWGMLSESWLTRHTFLSDLPTEEWLSENKAPVRAEFWNGGQLAEVIKFEDISAESIRTSRFQIPEDYQRVNFQQMLFNRMRNR